MGCGTLGIDIINSDNMKIEFINNNNRLFPNVKALGNKNSKTLGFMPDGGFDDYASKHSIIIAYDKQTLYGYLMYREVIRYNRVSIVHLCIDNKYRGQNIASKLLDALKQKYKPDYRYRGISLNCREDYEQASVIWRNYGFISQKSIRSRSFEEHYLGFWWYDFNRPDLFSNVESSKIQALLDMNILIKLRDSEINHKPTEDPRPLMADWLIDETEYYYAPECLNEITRDKNRNRTCETRKFIKNNFVEAKCDIDKVKQLARELEIIISGDSDNDKSDRRQIATSIVAEMGYFITFDLGIISKRECIEKKYNIQIYTPTEFILKIDHLLHKEEYIPTLLKGVSSTTIKKIDETDLNICVNDFCINQLGESKLALKNLVYNAIADTAENVVVIKNKNKILALYSYKFIDEILKISFVRLISDKTNQTMFMQIVSDFIDKAITRNLLKIQFQECITEKYQMSILLKYGFIKDSSNKLIKYVVNKVVDTESLKLALRGLEISNIINFNSIDSYHLLDIERIFFPLKIADIIIPCYIIPIKSLWAGNLFDYKISCCDIWGAQESKLWNIENIYFRHTHPINEKSPARILWYVSKDANSNNQRDGGIVATSYLDEVMTGKPKDLYLSSRHYGIYEWKDIYALCNKDIKKDIRALKFSRTEIFERAIPYNKIQEILHDNGRKKNTFTSPVDVGNSIFNQIYKLKDGK